MFMIPDYYDVTTLSFNEAIDVMTKHGCGDLLEGMESMNRIWSEYVESHNALARGDVDEVTFGDDDDFFDHYGYECSAYNRVFENFSKLFEKKS